MPSDGEYDQDPPSSVRQGGSDEEGEDLMDNMEAYVCCLRAVHMLVVHGIVLLMHYMEGWRDVKDWW